MTRVVINRCWGGFGLSNGAIVEYARRHGITLYAFRRTTGKWDERVPVLDGESTDGWCEFYTAPEPNDGDYYSPDIARDDPVLLALMDEWGTERVSGSLAELKVIEVPDGVRWEISDYDGMEHVAEQHRSWS